MLMTPSPCIQLVCMRKIIQGFGTVSDTALATSHSSLGGQLKVQIQNDIMHVSHTMDYIKTFSTLALENLYIVFLLFFTRRI